MSARMRYEGTVSVSRRFTRLAENAEDVSAAWPKVGRYLSRAIARQFTSEGAYFGTPWKPLKPKYKQWKARNGFSRKTLRMTGAMMRTFTGRPMDIERYTPKSAVFGSNDQKAVWHHYGTRRDGKRVNPPRRIVKLPTFVRQDVRDILKEHLMSGVKK